MTKNNKVCIDCRQGDCDSCYEHDCPCNLSGHQKSKKQEAPCPMNGKRAQNKEARNE